MKKENSLLSGYHKHAGILLLISAIIMSSTAAVLFANLLGIDMPFTEKRVEKNEGINALPPEIWGLVEKSQ